jgi:hypothetical protein
VLGAWRIYCARRAAVRSIRPFVERSRHKLGGISDGVWLDAYLIGFIGMLITLLAKRRSAHLGSLGLGLVQVGAWAEITDLDSGLIGEEICFLSLERGPNFAAGCENAQRFFNALRGRPVAEPADDPELASERMTASGPRNTLDAITGYVDPDTLWSVLFDSHVQAAQARAHPNPER